MLSVDQPSLVLEKKSLALLHPKELLVCLGPIKHRLDEVQSKLNHCGLVHLPPDCC